MVSAITEGEEKPLKYPLMFRACELVLINKIDLLPHLDFDLERFLYNLDAVHPGVERITVSAKTGEGIDEWRDWLASGRPSRGGARLSHLLGSDVLDRALSERTEANRAFFEAESERLARLCHRMAERFARGGRLIALGRSPAARSDARHVAVEFVHPVIVGKRALPALALAGEGGPLAEQAALAVEPGDIVIGFGSDADGALELARERGCLTLAFAPAGRGVGVRAADPGRLDSPGARRDALPRALGARARLLRPPRAARGDATHVARTTRARRASSIRSSPRARRTSRRWWRTCAARFSRRRRRSGSSGRRRSRRTARSCSPRPPACAPISRRADACSRSATAAPPPMRWTWWRTSAARPTRAGSRGGRST